MNFNLLKLFTVSGYNFEGKRSDENVILLLRRHWFVIFVRLLFLLILAFLPLVIFLFLANFISRYGLREVFDFLTAVYFLFWWLALFYKITMYLLDTWIVTDHRIIDSEQHGFFNRTVAELSLSRIQDVSVKVSGLINTFLDFGDLEVQTAGAENKFLFKQIPHPTRVKDLILRAHDQFMISHPGAVETEHESGGL